MAPNRTNVDASDISSWTQGTTESKKQDTIDNMKQDGTDNMKQDTADNMEKDRTDKRNKTQRTSNTTHLIILHKTRLTI